MHQSQEFSFDDIDEKENGPITEEIGSVLGKIRILKVLVENSGFFWCVGSNIIPPQSTKVSATPAKLVLATSL